MGIIMVLTSSGWCENEMSWYRQSIYNRVADSSNSRSDTVLVIIIHTSPQNLTRPTAPSPTYCSALFHFLRGTHLVWHYTFTYLHVYSTHCFPIDRVRHEDRDLVCCIPREPGTLERYFSSLWVTKKVMEAWFQGIRNELWAPGQPLTLKHSTQPLKCTYLVSHGHDQSLTPHPAPCSPMATSWLGHV